MIVRSAISVCQQPPWTISTTGCGPSPVGQPEVDDLQRVVAVADGGGGRGPRPLEQVGPGHQAVAGRVALSASAGVWLTAQAASASAERQGKRFQEWRMAPWRPVRG